MQKLLNSKEKKRFEGQRHNTKGDSPFNRNQERIIIKVLFSELLQNIYYHFRSSPSFVVTQVLNQFFLNFLRNSITVQK